MSNFLDNTLDTLYKTNILGGVTGVSSLFTVIMGYLLLIYFKDPKTEEEKKNNNLYNTLYFVSVLVTLSFGVFYYIKSTDVKTLLLLLLNTGFGTANYVLRDSEICPGIYTEEETQKAIRHREVISNLSSVFHTLWTIYFLYFLFKHVTNTKKIN